MSEQQLLAMLEMTHDSGDLHCWGCRHMQPIAVGAYACAWLRRLMEIDEWHVCWEKPQLKVNE